MRWSPRISRFRAAKEFLTHAHGVARKCHVPLWERASARAAEMNSAEARGYLRAHAGALVRREVEKLARAHHDLTGSVGTALVNCVVDQLVARVHGDIEALKLAPAGWRQVA